MFENDIKNVVIFENFVKNRVFNDLLNFSFRNAEKIDVFQIINVIDEIIQYDCCEKKKEFFDKTLNFVSFDERCDVIMFFEK